MHNEALGEYILQGWNDTARTLVGSGTRSRSRCRGSHPITILALSALLLTTVCAILSLDLGGWRRQLPSAARERERTWCDERFCLGGIGGVGLNLIHLDDDARFLIMRNLGRKQV